jgi:hypothetical protein
MMRTGDWGLRLFRAVTLDEDRGGNNSESCEKP